MNDVFVYALLSALLAAAFGWAARQERKAAARGYGFTAVLAWATLAIAVLLAAAGALHNLPAA